MINLDGNTTVHAQVVSNTTWSLRHRHRRNKLSHKVKIILLPRGNEQSEVTREEYHLSAKDGNLQSQTMLLNGKQLAVDSTGEIPSLDPVIVNSSEHIIIAPFSIVFVHMPNVMLPACK